MSENDGSDLPLLDKSLLGTGRFLISYDALDEMTRYEFDAEVIAARLRIFMALAYQRISYYSPPQAIPKLRDDDGDLARISGVGVAEWRQIKNRVGQAFETENGFWRLRGDPLHITSPGRSPMSAGLRAAVFARDGEICAYCGTSEGEFEIDHIHPVSKGGTDDLSNLTVACKPCNRSKGSMTLKEWRQ